MREVFRTKEGIITESVTKVNISDDGLYIDENCSNVRAYEKYGIKGYYNSLPKEIELFLEKEPFHCCELNVYEDEVTYTSKENGDKYISYNIKKERDITKLTPTYIVYDRGRELYEDVDEITFRYY